MSEKNKRGQNEGNIRKRKDGTWEARYTTGRGSDGKPIRKSIYGKERQEVSNKLNEILVSLNQGTYIEPSKMTVSTWLDVWFKEYVLPTKRTSTSKGYDDIVKVHLKPYLGHIPLKELKPENIQNMINEIQKKIPKRTAVQIENLEKKIEKVSNEEKSYIQVQIEDLRQQKISASTINHIIVMLGTSLSQAMKNGYIIRNVAKLVVKPQVEQKEIEVLSLEEQMKLLEYLHIHRLGFAFELCMATGLRQSELLGLRWEDVNYIKGTISIKHTIMRQRDFTGAKKTKIVKGKPKTKKGNREIPLPAAIIEKLKKHSTNQKEEKLKAGDAWKKTDLVFTSEIGTNVEPRKLLTIFHNLLIKAGLKTRGLHALRHSFATRAIEAGFDVKTLSEILGHEDVSTTLNLYVHSSEDEKKKQMQKLGFLFGG